MPTIQNDFDAKKVALNGSNLIEASAGTGKTFSIALMVVRLIVEKGVPIEKILMVTFTNAAVAELELRVRNFIRKAIQITSTGNYEHDEDPLSVIIKNAVEDTETGIEKVLERLNAATIFLDELAVMTIHSFCQKTLSEYSFETNQVFGAENISPDAFNELTEDLFNKFWRKNITTLDVETIRYLLDIGFTRDKLSDTIKNVIKGHKIISEPFLLNEKNRYIRNNELSVGEKINIAKNNIDDCHQNIINELSANKEFYISKCTNSHAKKNFVPLFTENNFEALLDLIIAKQSTNFCIDVFGDKIFPLIKIMDGFSENISNIIGVFAADEIESEINKAKNINGFITFDDMIDLLYNAVVVNENRTLISALEQKYQAVFIDEFQDTDKQQYGIFNKVFGEQNILFYIGDPKQSIYGFRKADINTYFDASKAVDNVYKMNTNFRSNKAMIESMNCFFKPTDNFDTFALDTVDSTERIFDYVPVNSPEPNSKGYLFKNETAVKTLSLSGHKNKKKLLEGVISTVIALLGNTGYVINEQDNVPRKVMPSDIGILVRKNSEGRAIKEWLSKSGIPAITVDDSKLLKSPEANELFYILEAVNSIEQGLINKALLTKIAGYTKETLLDSNEEDILTRFRTYQESWRQKGVFVMLKQFVSDHNLSARLLGANIKNGERLVSNILQLIEIIHSEEVHQKYDPKELIQWLKKGIEGKTIEGDEYEQRIESDEDAVKIVTIHKCKGLEYNIVLAPYMDLLPESKRDTISFRNPNDFIYYSIYKKSANDEEKTWSKDQTEQENRRLLYVAITRARMKCFVYFNTYHYYNSSCLRDFLKGLALPIDTDTQKVNTHYEKWVPDPINYRFRYSSFTQKETINYAVTQEAKIPLLQPNWRKTSYSALSPEYNIPSIPKTTIIMGNEYDEFTFRNLKKGAHTGNLLHYILENLSFDNTDNWTKVIDRALNRLSAVNKDYTDNIKYMLEQVTGVFLPVNKLSETNTPFCLKELKNEFKLNELEFDFPLKPFNTDRLKELSTVEIPFHVKSYAEIEGIMNGKMDLFFKMHDKYYILDWKSNFLGESLEDYVLEKVVAVMGDNNYHLQYHIYTIAAKKYLAHCIEDFDYDLHFGGVIYLFLRGIRTGKENGLFLHKPSKEIIEKMEIIIS